MIDYQTQHRRRAAARDLRPSNATPCPRVTAGRRCLLGNPSTACVCAEHRHLLDHARQWHDHDGRRVLTCEPYDVAVEELAAFGVGMAPLGLIVTPWPGPGMWHPSTLVYAVTREVDRVACKAAS
ncbi:MAG: hypothetical protein ACR2KG_11595 [Nocardioidaceae bacterium]